MRALTLGPIVLLLVPGPIRAALPASPRPTPSAGSFVADDVFSSHARRLIRTYLRLRMLELREADLERARAAIEGRLRIDDLLVTPPPRPEK